MKSESFSCVMSSANECATALDKYQAIVEFIEIGRELGIYVTKTNDAILERLIDMYAMTGGE